VKDLNVPELSRLCLPFASDDFESAFDAVFV
jgi:hypothetical protein